MPSILRKWLNSKPGSQTRWKVRADIEFLLIVDVDANAEGLRQMTEWSGLDARRKPRLRPDQRLVDAIEHAAEPFDAIEKADLRPFVPWIGPTHRIFRNAIPSFWLTEDAAP